MSYNAGKSNHMRYVAHATAAAGKRVLLVRREGSVIVERIGDKIVETPTEPTTGFSSIFDPLSHFLNNRPG